MFSPATQTWFEQSFESPTEIQERGWSTIAAGRHALLAAPTGSGKTLAAFLAGIDRVAQLETDAEPGVRVLYVSPLKALVYDVERNLRAPLVGIQRVGESLGSSLRTIDVAMRTGDTPAKERQRQLRQPGDILVTTPESLYLLLGSRARMHFRTVHTVIIDEIHALAPTKRGAHLALSLERLSEIAERDPQRIGLSATVRPLDEVARFLGGQRSVEVIDASRPPALDLTVTVPVPDMENPPAPKPSPDAPDGDDEPGGSILGELYRRNLGVNQQERGIWPAIYPEVLAAIRESRSTIVFVNSRGLCERLAQRLNELAEEELVAAHHGSVSHEKRTEIEEGLKSGRIRGIVATSSLELGIDMGAVDRVLLIESPRSVARGLQRVGRAGHQVGATSVGRIFPKFRGDLLECAVIAGRMQEGEIEPITVVKNALDVLAQQVTAMVCDTDRSVESIGELVRRAYPYSELSDGALESVLDMLSGRYPSSDFADLRPLLSWDRSTQQLSARRGTKTIMHMNAGTIPDRGAYAVYLVGGGSRLGELDEEMVYETRVGDNIMLGASTWRVEVLERNRVLVSPAPGEPGRLPFWKGEGPGRPVELGEAIGRFAAEVTSRSVDDAIDWVVDTTPLDRLAAQNLVSYVHEQKEHTGTLPTDTRITVERFRDELGDWRVCILTPFGSRLHAPWAMAIQRKLATHVGFEVQVLYTDDGIVLRYADGEERPDLELLLPSPDEVEDLVTEQLADSALFAGLFRENSVRALLMTRRRPDQRTPLWVQRVKSQNLLATVRQFSTFPVVLETYRQALRDTFDLPSLERVLGRIQERTLRVDEVETTSASPFSRSLVFAYVAASIYEQDSPLAERRAQALTLDRQLLGELLGQAELRELLDAEIIAQVEAELQATADGWRARDPDELHDLLRRLGDLTPAEIDARTEGDGAGWTLQLEEQRRASRGRFPGSDGAVSERWLAAEDAGRYRDAFGIHPASGLPDAFLAPVEDARGEVARRFARTHGPFTTEEFARRYGLATPIAAETLERLSTAGTLVRGEIRPGGAEPDWCDREVLRRIKRQTLAKLRGEVAPVDARVVGAFLPEWHGVDADREGAEALLDAIGALQGLPLSFRELVTTILPRRVRGFRLDLLDLLAASGSIVWVGCGAIGSRDGRIALYRRESIAALSFRPEGGERDARVPAGSGAGANPGKSGNEVERESNAELALEELMLSTLEERGASFQFEWFKAVQAARPATGEREFQEALWDLVWSGQLTNDTFGPLQSFGTSPKRRGGRSRRPGFTAGRWSTVRSLTTPTPAPTECAVTRTEVLLERYGIACREGALADDFPGGFSPIYRVLHAMEEAGKIRRGAFVDGWSGAQFARPGAIDRLRSVRDAIEEAEQTERALDPSEVLALPTIDPANPYGSVLPWPPTTVPDGARPRRTAGTWIVMVRGVAVLFVGSRGRQLLTFADAGPNAIDAALTALANLNRFGAGRLTVETIDGEPVRETVLGRALVEHGFEAGYRGYSSPS